MSQQGVSLKKPGRMDKPFDPNMTTIELDRIMSSELLQRLDDSRFPDSMKPEHIARNDMRLMRYRPGDIVVRQGDYGTTAYFVVKGDLRAVAAPELTHRILGNRPPRSRGFMSGIKRFFGRHNFPEYRHIKTGQTLVGTRMGERNTEMRSYIQDVKAVLEEFDGMLIGPNEMLGEVAALSRYPRIATVFAETPALLIEIRWQGLRDIMRRDPGLRAHIFSLYRDRGLTFHLKATQLFADFSESELKRVADSVRFESYGDIGNVSYGGRDASGRAETRLDHEPLIAEENDYVNGLGIICSGFVRSSVRVNFGHRTLSYLGRGQHFGLAEIAHNHDYETKVNLQHSYRAVGFTDILWIPVPIVEELVLPRLGDKKPAPIMASIDRGRFWEALEQHEAVDEGLMEFVVDERFHNGSAAMVINLDRCTGCDDCVRACATAHDNNPRFVRHGKRFGNLQVASACMHCLDPTCMIGCPTGAIYRSGGSTLVEINPETCIGCSSCANNCSYNNIRMVPIRDGEGKPILDLDTQAPMVQATKCDLCVNESTGPACQYACPQDALMRLDMRDLEKLARWGRS